VRAHPLIGFAITSAGDNNRVEKLLHIILHRVHVRHGFGAAIPVLSRLSLFKARTRVFLSVSVIRESGAKSGDTKRCAEN
jgi:hypothetical protein